MKKIIALLMVVGLVLSCAAVSFAAEAPKAAEAKKEAPKPKILKEGDLITEFALPDGLNKDAKISYEKDIKGKSKAMIISFMTTACSACKAELTLLNDLANKYGDDLKIYSISVDLNGDKSIPVYDKTFGFNVKYMLDPDFKIAQLFGFSYTPSFVLANKDGKILFMKGGFASGSDSDEIIAAVKDAVTK